MRTPLIMSGQHAGSDDSTISESDCIEFLHGDSRPLLSECMNGCTSRAVSGQRRCGAALSVSGKPLVVGDVGIAGNVRVTVE